MSASTTDRKRVGRTQWIPKIPPITERMREIHAAFCAGESGRQIGRRLGVSQHWIQQVIRRVHEANREARLEMVREGKLP
jgi:Mor family transcriptional regulator